MSDWNPGQTRDYVPGLGPKYQRTPSQDYDEAFELQQGPVSYVDDKSAYQGDRFRPNKRLNDPIFLILFLLVLIAYIAISAIAIAHWFQNGGFNNGFSITENGNKITLNGHTVGILLGVLGVALLLSVVYLIFVRLFTKFIIHLSLILTIIVNIAIAVFYFIKHIYITAIILSAFSLLLIFAYWGYYKRIPLSTLLLQTVMDIANEHLSVYFVALLSMTFQAVLCAWFVFAAIATYENWTPNGPNCKPGTLTSCSDSKVIGLVVFEVFAFVWTSAVSSNVVLATLAGGPFGCWYYFGPREQGNMPSHPTLSAFGRASTLSLGSIAFGTLIVAILETIKILLNAAKDNAADDGEWWLACLACCAECFVGCLENVFEYFNQYAYIQIALYGKSYISSARHTWRMFKDRGIDAIINDSLVGMTMMWGAYTIGLLGALGAYLYLHYTHPAYNANGQYTAPVVIFAFIIGFACTTALASAIQAGVSTIFVGLAEDPQILAVRSPPLFDMIARMYPQVTQPVPKV